MPFRKREATRIDEENQRMIERIMKANSSIPFKKLEKDYQNHLQFKKIIQKSQPMPVERLIQKKQKKYGGGSMESHILPPIDSTSESKKGKSGPFHARSSSEAKTSRNHNSGNQ